MSTNSKNKKWTKREDQILLNQIRVFPQNLTRCFAIVAKTIGRTPGAVSGHWYTKVSKDPDSLCFFTASSKHVSKNRKNGMGVESNKSIWKKFIAIIKNL